MSRVASIETKGPVHRASSLANSPEMKDVNMTVVVFGASGDLAKKKTYPALFGLFKNNLLPPNVRILGYARSELAHKEFITRVTDKIKIKTDHDKKLLEEFVKILDYIHGGYEDEESFRNLKKKIQSMHVKQNAESHVVWYLALPPSVFLPVATNIRKIAYADGINRLIVEKPFGKDTESSNQLSRDLAALFTEDEIFRIDHYLGKEMVKNIMVMRFANVFFNGVWHRNHIDNVQITFKEPFGTEGRGGYFDEFGIIRDIIQNHLLQILTIVAMDRPVSLGAEDVRDEKVKVLRCIAPLTMDRTLLGQYTASADGKNPGYLDDKTVPKGSNCPTYAATVLFIENERWAGVPFILKAGKALDEQKTEIRIQFKDVPGSIFPNLDRNELVIRVQPNEAVYMKMMNKLPGLGTDTVISELDLSYGDRYGDRVIPEAYEALILDVLKGDHSNFVRDDELEAAWKIFTPLLHQVENGQGGRVKPEEYAYGSRGPASLTDFVKKFGYMRNQQEYLWRKGGKL